VPTPAPTATPHQTPLPTDDPETATASPTFVPTGVASSSPAAVVNPLRVESADAGERGIFETVIASLLSFFLG
jgi:hypothetical protein